VEVGIDSFRGSSLHLAQEPAVRDRQRRPAESTSSAQGTCADRSTLKGSGVQDAGRSPRSQNQTLQSTFSGYGAVWIAAASSAVRG
jgi:hypothetical protein